MKPEQENSINLIASKEDVDANARVLEIYDTYDKVSGILERTHIAMGKKRKFVMSSSSSGSEKIVAHASPSTH